MTVTGKPRVIVVMGPTASGKSALAIQLAQRLNGEIISVDSALVYRGMDIGTAKPPLAERGGISHHLLDILDPAQSYSTAQFRAQALELIAAIAGRGRLPFLVGGTMLYFNALLHGLSVLPPADPVIRQAIEEKATRDGWGILHDRLAAIDPEAAARIHRHDPQRIQRALEVYELTGKPLSAFFKEQQTAELPFHALKLIVAPDDRAQLHAAIARRFHAMLAQGLIEEVERLYMRGDLHPGMPSIRAVGYRQVWAYLAGNCDYATMCDKAIAATRQLAKRQFTWLRRETGAAVFASNDTALLDKVLRHIAAAN